MFDLDMPGSLGEINGYLLLAGVAFLAGALNAVAGGGSFFSFPALLTVGLPPVNANATNTVALWPGQLTSIFALRRELQSVRSLMVPAMTSAAIGGVTGAFLLLITGQARFMRLVPWLLLFATVLFAISGPLRKWLDRHQAEVPTGPLKSMSVGLFFWLTVVGIYIGYFGAGAGFLVMTVLSLFGVGDFHQSNALKILCNAVANGLAVVTFIFAGAIFWRECMLMLLFAAAGGYFGAAYSRKLNPRVLRMIVIVCGSLLSGYYFWKTYFQS